MVRKIEEIRNISIDNHKSVEELVLIINHLNEIAKDLNAKLSQFK